MKNIQLITCVLVALLITSSLGQVQAISTYALTQSQNEIYSVDSDNLLWDLSNSEESKKYQISSYNRESFSTQGQRYGVSISQSLTSSKTPILNREEVTTSEIITIGEQSSSFIHEMNRGTVTEFITLQSDAVENPTDVLNRLIEKYESFSTTSSDLTLQIVSIPIIVQEKYSSMVDRGGQLLIDELENWVSTTADISVFLFGVHASLDTTLLYISTTEQMRSISKVGLTIVGRTGWFDAKSYLLFQRNDGTYNGLVRNVFISPLTILVNINGS